MKRYWSFIAVGISLFLLTSCQKEVEETLAVPPAPNEHLVRQVIMLDTSQAHPADTIQYAGFKYDSDERNTYFYIVSQFASGNIDTLFKTWLFYTGASKQPSHYILHVLDEGNVIESRDTVYLTYDTEGFIKKDSSCYTEVGGFRTIAVQEYTVSGNKVTKVTRTYGADLSLPPVIFTSVYYQQHLGGNLTTQLDTTAGFRDEYFNTFDSKHNPLYENIPIRYRDFGPDNYIFENTNKNNIAEVQFTDKHIATGTIQEEHYKYVYQYDSDGYPVTAKQFDLKTGTPDYFKYIYKYY